MIFIKVTYRVCNFCKMHGYLGKIILFFLMENYFYVMHLCISVVILIEHSLDNFREGCISLNCSVGLKEYML